MDRVDVVTNDLGSHEPIEKVTFSRNDNLAKDDQAGLAAIGKVQVFERKFNFWTALGITLCASGTWEGTSASILQALSLGGPVGLLYGFILTGAAMTCTAAALSEFASMWPSAGAQYHWAAELSPPKLRPFLSWFAGWITYAYTWTAVVSCSMGIAVQTQAYVAVGHPSYVAERWHAYLIYALVTAIDTTVNIFGVKIVHYLSLSGFMSHVVGYFLVMIILLVYTKDKHDASFVFTTFINSSGWSSDGVAFCAGLMTTMFGFAGIETAAHFAEEIQHVRKSLPRAMFYTILLNAVIVFPWLVALLYCSGNIANVLNSPIGLSSPITQIYINSTGNVALSIFLGCFITYIAFIGGVNALGSCSRTLWAMSRDHAFPKAFSRVHLVLDVPVQCILASALPQLLIGLIYIWNQTAFYGIISGVLALYTLSYAIPLGLGLFYARWNDKWIQGPWSLGRLSLPIHLLAFCWAIFIFIFLCFPLYQPVTVANMNYAIVIVGAFAFLGVGWYFIYMRGKFWGPIVEILTDLSTESVESRVHVSSANLTQKTMAKIDGGKLN